MVKNNSKTSKDNKYVNSHVQMDGNANYDHWEKKGDQGDSFFFTPNITQIGAVATFRKRGTAQQMSDGSFEFIVKQDSRAHSRLIKKLAHGRLSETRDGMIQLTLRISLDEDIDKGGTLINEAIMAATALV